MLFDTSRYLQIIASLLPKEVTLNRPLANLSDDELAEAINALTEAIRANQAAEVDKETLLLPAVSHGNH